MTVERFLPCVRATASEWVAKAHRQVNLLGLELQAKQIPEWCGVLPVDFLVEVIEAQAATLTGVKHWALNAEFRLLAPGGE